MRPNDTRIHSTFANTRGPAQPCLGCRQRSILLPVADMPTRADTAAKTSQTHRSGTSAPSISTTSTNSENATKRRNSSERTTFDNTSNTATTGPAANGPICLRTRACRTNRSPFPCRRRRMLQRRRALHQHPHSSFELPAYRPLEPAVPSTRHRTKANDIYNGRFTKSCSQSRSSTRAQAPPSTQYADDRQPNRFVHGQAAASLRRSRLASMAENGSKRAWQLPSKLPPACAHSSYTARVSNTSAEPHCTRLAAKRRGHCRLPCHPQAQQRLNFSARAAPSTETTRKVAEDPRTLAYLPSSLMPSDCHSFPNNLNAW